MAVTRADVAQLARVSPAVVSYVLNDGPRPVSAGTRARVEEAIAALDYRPNAVASALRGGLTRSMGLLIPDPVNPFFAELAGEVEKALFDHGNTLSIGITNDDAARELAYVRSFVSRRFDGLVLVSSRAIAGVEERELASTPVLLLDRAAEHPGIASVHIDNIDGASRATEHLQRHGHTLIALVAGPPTTRVTAERIAGWRSQQSRAGLDHGDDLVAFADFSETGGVAAASSLLAEHGRPAARRGRRPTALVVSSDVQAMGVLHACHTAGLRVPEDVALVSFDGTTASRYAQPSMTTVRQPIPTIAGIAVAHLLERIAHPDTTVRHTTVRGNLRIGGSCGCSPRHTPTTARTWAGRSRNRGP